MNNTLATLQVTIATVSGESLNEKGLGTFTDALTDMLDDGVLADKIAEALVEAGAPRDVADCLVITYEEVRPETTVLCKFCEQQVPVSTAHRHAGGWVGDDCCWDERLRSTE